VSTNSIRPAFSSAYVLVEMWISFARGSLYSIKTMSGRRWFICGWGIPRKGLDISKRIRAWAWAPLQSLSLFLVYKLRQRWSVDEDLRQGSLWQLPSRSFVAFYNPELLPQMAYSSELIFLWDLQLLKSLISEIPPCKHLHNFLHYRLR